jgi:hypothetical protein
MNELSNGLSHPRSLDITAGDTDSFGQSLGQMLLGESLCSMPSENVTDFMP